MPEPRRHRRAHHADLVLPQESEIEMIAPRRTSAEDVVAPHDHVIEITEPTVIEGDPNAGRIEDLIRFGPQIAPIVRIGRDFARDPGGAAMALGEGVSQGGTAGAADEIGGGIVGGLEYLRRRVSGDDDVSLSDEYHRARDEIRSYADEAHRRAPDTYEAFDVAASTPHLLALPLPRGTGIAPTLGRIAAGAGYMGGESILRNDAPIEESLPEAGRDAAIGGAVMAIPEMVLSGAGALRTARARGRLSRLERQASRGGGRAQRGPSPDLSDEMVDANFDPDMADPLDSVTSEGHDLGQLMEPIRNGEMPGESGLSVSDAVHIDPDMQRILSVGHLTPTQIERLRRLPGGIERASEILQETGVLGDREVARDSLVGERAALARERAGTAVQEAERQMADIQIPIADMISGMRQRSRALGALSSPEARSAAAYLEEVADRLEASGGETASLPARSALDEMRAYDNAAQWNRTQTGTGAPPSVTGARAARRGLRNAIDTALGTANPELAQTYGQARERFQYLSSMQPRTTSARRAVSLTDLLAGGTAGATIGGQVAGAPGAALGFAAGVGANRLYRQVENSLWARIVGGERVPAQELAPAIERLREVAARTPEAFGTYGNAAMRAAMAGGPEWTDFLDRVLAEPDGAEALDAASAVANEGTHSPEGNADSPYHTNDSPPPLEDPEVSGSEPPPLFDEEQR